MNSLSDIWPILSKTNYRVCHFIRVFDVTRRNETNCVVRCRYILLTFLSYFNNGLTVSKEQTSRTRNLSSPWTRGLSTLIMSNSLSVKTKFPLSYSSTIWKMFPIKSQALNLDNILTFRYLCANKSMSFNSSVVNCPDQIIKSFNVLSIFTRLTYKTKMHLDYINPY